MPMLMVDAIRSGGWLDSFQSFLSGLGVIGRDKGASGRAILRELTMQELVNLYRGDWLSRKIIDIPAFDSCRAWRSWEAQRHQITKLEETERHFGLQRKVMLAMSRARLFGGAAIVMGVEGTGEWNEPLDPERVKKGALKFLHVVERQNLQAGQVIRDITNPWFGEPEYYTRSNPLIAPAPGGVRVAKPYKIGNSQGGEPMFDIHPSRVVRFIGLDYPDMEMAPDAWGDSVLQTIHDAIRDAGMVSQSVAHCIAEMKVDVIKMPGLSNSLSTDAGAAKVSGRWARANAAKSVINGLLIDKNEEIDRLYPHLEGIPQLLQMFLLMAAAAADIPSTRLLSREPAGQNATGDSDTRNYYDRLSSDQKVRITPTMSRLDEVLIRTTLGNRPDELQYGWNPLWQLDEVQKSEIALRKAQAFKIDNDTALLPPEVLQQARENQLIEDGTYPGLDQALIDYELAMERVDSEFDDKPDVAAGDNPDESDITDALQSSLAFQISRGSEGGDYARKKRAKRRKRQLRIAYPKLGDEDRQAVYDDMPRTLYVFRPLLNFDDVSWWAKQNGFASMIPDPHVTVLYSKAPLDWSVIGTAAARCKIPNDVMNERTLERLDVGVVALRFSSSDLAYRHDFFVQRGASHDYDAYRPHLTISYEVPPEVDLDQIEPYRGVLEFGPEQFREIDPARPPSTPPEIPLAVALAAE